MESGDTIRSDSFRKHSSKSSSEGVHLEDDRKLSPSSSISSGSSSFGFEFGADEFTRSHTSESSGANEHDTQLGVESHDNNIVVSSMASQEQESSHSPIDGSATQLPPTQVMERPADNSYRIPPSVFARNQSTTPMEWSAASNESLFSIPNISFTRDMTLWLDPASSPYIDFSSKELPSGQQSIEVGQNHVGVSESKAAETMMEVIKENEANDRMRKSDANGANFHVTSPSIDGRVSVSDPTSASTITKVIKERQEEHNREKANSNKGQIKTASLSRHSSGTSVKSFAFPILTGDDRCSNHKRHPSSQPQSQPTTPKCQQTEMSLQSQPQSPSSQSQTPKRGDSIPKATPNGGPSKWFSCFPRIRFCS